MLMAEKNHVCSSCEKKFSNKKDIESHKRQYHTLPKLTCDKCDRSPNNNIDFLFKTECFSRGTHFVATEKASSPTPFTFCDICGKGFERRQSRTMHLKEVHKK